MKRDYKIGDCVRLRNGCVWLFGTIDSDNSNDYYECSYGTKKQYEKTKNGFSFNYFAHFHISDIKPI